MDAILPWEQFSNWVHCICILTFDLEIGQALEAIFPSNASLSETEKTNICYLSFPDSNSGCMGDTTFHFRIRKTGGSSTLRLSTRKMLERYNRECAYSFQADPNFYYGFVYFRQVRDKSIPRGYFQKSVILLTHLPLTNLFDGVIRSIAPEYFENGEPGIEAACQNIEQWPAPMPGVVLNLPLMGSVARVRLPSRFDANGSSPEHLPIAAVDPETSASSPFTSTTTRVLPIVQEANLYENLLPVLAHIHLLWELVLLAEPLAVMATSPTACSSIVQTLVSLIWPLKYCVDYRPFFTIHDSEFKEYSSKPHSTPNVMLGVTNPFFAKALENWPHVLRFCENASATGTPNGSPSVSAKLKKGRELRTIDQKPGIYSRYKAFLNRDKQLLKRLMKGMQSKRPVEAQSQLIRRHFVELTQSFIIPLERYIASQMPLQKHISPFKSAPKMREFDVEEFLSTVEASGPHLTCTIKGDWIGLYKRFVQCPNFLGWYRHRQSEINQKLQLLHLEVLCAAEVKEALSTKQEVEIVDFALKLRESLAFADAFADEVKDEWRTKLKAHYETVLESLREDLRMVLLSKDVSSIG